jgi:hypothetical protein
VDFFTVSTLTGRVLFVLVVISHDGRRIVHVNFTEHPASAWTAQQLVEAFPEDSAPRWLLVGSNLRPSRCVAPCCRLPLFVASKGQEKGNVSRDPLEVIRQAETPACAHTPDSQPS